MNGMRNGFDRDLLARDCKRAIRDLSVLADNASATGAASVLLSSIDDSLSALENFEAALRKAVERCEDVTNEVYILSVLANVEVGAHSDTIDGFEVIAKQIQPLAESGAMAAIDAKASLDSAFAPLEGMRENIKGILKEISSDNERRRRLLTRIEDAARSLERLADSIGAEDR